MRSSAAAGGSIGEIDLIEPQLAVALGATAARGLFSRPITIARVRGAFMKLRDRVEGFVTVHPSSLLRAPDEVARAREYEKFVHDMRLIARPGHQGLVSSRFSELRSRGGVC